MSTEAVTLQVADDGSLTIPANLIRTLKISPRQNIIVEAREDALVIAPPYLERLERIGHLLKSALADVKWKEIEDGRGDRWF